MNILSTARTLLIAALIASGIWLQAHILVTGDIAWLMHVGQKLLNGGRYYRDFFEVNPPMCIYIYLLPVLASQIFKLSFISTIIIYIYMLIGFSGFLCHYLLKKIFPASALLTRYCFEVVLTFTYLVLPAYAFGQREYLLIVLFLPYLLLAALRCQQVTINTWLAIIIGILAAIGCAQKPFFLSMWLLVEMYLIIKHKKLTYYLRPEGLACITIFIIYGISLLVFTPEYITQIFPIIKTVYYLEFHASIPMLITSPLSIFAFLLTILYSITRKYIKYVNLADLLFASLISTYIIFLMQHTLWYYHLLPIAMIGSLLLGLLLSDFFQQNNLFKITQLNWQLGGLLLLGSCLLSLTIFPVLSAVYNNQVGLGYTENYFSNPIYPLTKTVAGKPIYIVTDNIAVNYPLADYTQTDNVSLFPCLWLLNTANRLPPHIASQQQLAKTLIDLVVTKDVAAMLKTPPVLILVQLKSYYWTDHKIKTIPYIKHDLEKRSSPNYLKYFLQNSQFAKFWQNYQYEGVAGDFAVYRLKTVHNS